MGRSSKRHARHSKSCTVDGLVSQNAEDDLTKEGAEGDFTEGLSTQQVEGTEDQTETDHRCDDHIETAVKGKPAKDDGKHGMTEADPGGKYTEEKVGALRKYMGKPPERSLKWLVSVERAVPNMACSKDGKLKVCLIMTLTARCWRSTGNSLIKRHGMY